MVRQYNMNDPLEYAASITDQVVRAYGMELLWRISGDSGGARPNTGDLIDIPMKELVAQWNTLTGVTMRFYTEETAPVTQYQPFIVDPNIRGNASIGGNSVPTD